MGGLIYTILVVSIAVVLLSFFTVFNWLGLVIYDSTRVVTATARNTRTAVKNVGVARQNRILGKKQRVVKRRQRRFQKRGLDENGYDEDGNDGLTQYERRLYNFEKNKVERYKKGYDQGPKGSKVRRRTREFERRALRAGAKVYNPRAATREVQEATRELKKGLEEDREVERRRVENAKPSRGAYVRSLPKSRRLRRAREKKARETEEATTEATTATSATATPSILAQLPPQQQAFLLRQHARIRTASLHGHGILARLQKSVVAAHARVTTLMGAERFLHAYAPPTGAPTTPPTSDADDVDPSDSDSEDFDTEDELEDFDVLCHMAQTLAADPHLLDPTDSDEIESAVEFFSQGK
jgi:hypothetical protein